MSEKTAKPKTVQEAIIYIQQNWGNTDVNRWTIREAMGLDEEAEDPKDLDEIIEKYNEGLEQQQTGSNDLEGEGESLDQFYVKMGPQTVNSNPVIPQLTQDSTITSQSKNNSNTITPKTQEKIISLSPHQIEKTKDSNTITQEIKRQSIDKATLLAYKLSKSSEQIYKWAISLTTEQKPEDKYLWTKEAKLLRRRISETDGNLIAVKGLQGVGKTALKQELYYDLNNQEKKTVSWKWLSSPEKDLTNSLDKENPFLHQFDRHYILDLFEALWDDAQKQVQNRTCYDCCSAIGKRLNLSDGQVELLTDYYQIMKKQENQRSEDEKLRSYEVSDLCGFMEKALGRKRITEIKKERLLAEINRVDNFIIDLPDYDRKSIKQMSKDLTSIQNFWENYLIDSDGSQKGNLIVFFQEELFYGHFFLGKFYTISLKPFTSQELTDYFLKKFPDSELFEKEAIEEIVALSRGIMRRFKKYISISIEQWDNRFTPITREDINTWITFDQVIKDMELELMTVFPNEKEHRVLTVRVLRFLREQGGSAKQSDVIEAVFDGEGKATEMKASRLLSKLETAGYIDRPRNGKEKMVSLKN